MGTSISPPGRGGAQKPWISSGFSFPWPPGLQFLHCFLVFYEVSAHFFISSHTLNRRQNLLLLSTIHLVSLTYPLSSATHQTSPTGKMGLHSTSHFTGLLCVKEIDDFWTYRCKIWLYSYPQLFLIVCLKAFMYRLCVLAGGAPVTSDHIVLRIKDLPCLLLIPTETLKLSGHAIVQFNVHWNTGSAQECFLLVGYFPCACLTFDKTV